MVYAAAFGRSHDLGAYVLRSHGNIPVCGDKKKAIEQLRASRFFTSHHLSTFISGLFIGLAILALIDGLVKGQCF